MHGAPSHLKAYVALVIILVIALGFVYGLYDFFGTPQQPSILQTENGLPANAPAPTAADQVSAQRPFQYLISYTASGFHPTSLSIKAGQTIRFTDNAPQQIVVAGQNGSSPSLSQNMYWQYTATAAGTETFTAPNSTFSLTVTN